MNLPLEHLSRFQFNSHIHMSSWNVNFLHNCCQHVQQPNNMFQKTLIFFVSVALDQGIGRFHFTTAQRQKHGKTDFFSQISSHSKIFISFDSNKDFHEPNNHDVLFLKLFLPFGNLLMEEIFWIFNLSQKSKIKKTNTNNNQFPPNVEFDFSQFNDSIIHSIHVVFLCVLTNRWFYLILFFFFIEQLQCLFY